MELIPFQPLEFRALVFDIFVTIGSSPGLYPPDLNLTKDLPCISALKNIPKGTDQKLLVIDYCFCDQNFLSSDHLVSLSFANIDSITSDTYNYVSVVSQACLEYSSVTLLRLLPESNTDKADLSIKQSLTTGALRSLQSEHPNLTVSAVTFDPTFDKGLSQSLLDNILSSSFIPSDLYVDSCGKLFARNTRSLRLGIEKVQSSALSVQWKTVFVFGGASALALECLRCTIDSTTDVYLFGRRPYDRIFDDFPILRETKDLNEYVLQYEPEHGLNIKDLRARTSYLSSQIELSKSIESIELLCRSVHYYSCDITDAPSLSLALSSVQPHFNNSPTAIIFAAGLLRDSLIANMNQVDFSDVVSVKCLGLLNVIKSCPLDNLKSLYVFGSVSGTYGNKGQANYSAANEGLYRISQLFSELNPNIKTVLFSWGPWAEVGMALPEVNAQFKRRGICPLTNHQGTACFLYTASLEETGFYAPVFGFAPWNDLESTFNTGLSPDLGSIYTLREKLSQQGSVVNYFRDSSLSTNVLNVYRFELARLPLFSDHILSGHYVVPFAFALELYFDVVLRLYKSSGLALCDVRCLKGIQVPLDTKFLELSVKLSEDSSTNKLTALIYLADSVTPNYTASIVNSVSVTDPLVSNIVSPDLSQEQLPSVQYVYHNYLFHGSSFQVIQSLRSASMTSIKASIFLAGVSSDIALLTSQSWICPPPLFDSVAQLALIWRRLFDNQTALPSSLSSFFIHDYTRLTGELDIILDNISTTDFDMSFDVFIYGVDGELLASAHDMSCTCSSSLNRLNQEWVSTLESRPNFNTISV